MEALLAGKTDNAVEQIRSQVKDADSDKKYQSYSAKSTPLEHYITDMRLDWLTQYVCERWRVLHSGLTQWREKMTKWEELSKDDYSYRITEPNPEKPEIAPDIFRIRNGSMGLTAGFVDFVSAQAKNDIFGTYPWLAANPEGKSDRKLAELVTKHSQWKFNQTSLEEVLLDAIEVAAWGGTSFVKPRWDEQVEVYHRSVSAAYSKSQKGFLMAPDGGYVESMEVLAAIPNLDPEDIEWKNRFVEEPTIVYDNIRASVLDYRDVAFDPQAAELDLNYTDFFHTFRMGFLDAIETFKIPADKVDDLRNALVTPEEEVRGEDGETSATVKMPGYETDDANPMISLIEGYVRVNALGNNKPPVRIHVIFSYDMNILFKADYLANITPSGMLPVFPVRVHKIARRIFGRGYFEKYEDDNNAVDRQHNAIVHRNELSANVMVGVDSELFEDESEGIDILVDSSKPKKMKTGNKISDAISYSMIPDENNRSNEILNQRMQMAQMKSGITSAAQGQLSGVPNASTATGVMQMQSRGALLLKEQIGQISKDIEKCAEYCVHLNYANLDRDEVFTWGEGSESELYTIKAADVQGLRMNVSLTLVQAQNLAKLENARAAIGIATQYINLPEPEKAAQRMLYVEAITMLGFNEAEDIIREAVVDVSTLIAMLPVEQQAQVQNALIQSGVIAPPEMEGAPAEEAQPQPAQV